MRRIALVPLILSCALAADAAAQAAPSTRRPPRDTIRVGRTAADSIRRAEEGDVVSIDELEEEPAVDTVPEPTPGPYARAGGTGPFTVQASGEPAPRPARGEVVWVNTGPARPAASDTARTGSGQRVTSGQPTRRDTASAPRPAPRDTARTGSGQRVTSGQTPRRDTATATRPTSSDTARTGTGQRVTSGQAARRETARTRPTTSATTPATGRTNPSGARSRTHTVAAGETFYGIARRYGVTAAQLRALNPDVDMDALEVGDVLRLPAGARDSRPSTQPGSGTQPRTGSAAQTPPRGSRTHTVAAGETLFGIARRYGVTVAAIRQANGMDEDEDQVRAGQRLVIPPAR